MVKKKNNQKNKTANNQENSENLLLDDTTDADGEQKDETGSSNEVNPPYSALRFKVGDKVLCRRGNEWLSGDVAAVWTYEGDRLVPYIVNLHSEFQAIWAPVDRDGTIRAFVPPGIDRVLQSIQCLDDEDGFEEILPASGVEVSEEGERLMIETANAGNFNIAFCLCEVYDVNPLTVKNKDGRNIFHIAAMKNNEEYLDGCVESEWNKEDLLEALDDRGLNLVHFLAMSKDINLIRGVLYENWLGGWKPSVDLLEPNAFSHLFDYPIDPTDPSTPTPIEWAKRNKLFEIFEVFEKYLMEGLLDLFLCNILTEIDKFDAVSIFQTKCDRFVQKYHKDFSEIYFSAFAKDVLFGIFMHYCLSGNVSIIQFLILILQLDFKIEYFEFAGKLITETLRGPKEERILKVLKDNRDELQGYVEDRNYNYRLGLNYYVQKWDGREYIQKFLQNKTRVGIHLDNEFSRSWEPKTERDRAFTMSYGKTISEEYIRVFMAQGNGSKSSDRRIQVLKWFLKTVPALKKKISPEIFISPGQVEILQWVINSGYVDLSAQAIRCESLIQYAVTMFDWLRPPPSKNNKKKKTKPRVISATSELTVGELMCFLAVEEGEFYLFHWLFTNHLNGDCRSLTLNGWNLLHIATYRKHAVIVRFLIGNNYIPLLSKTPEGRNACLIAVDVGVDYLWRDLKDSTLSALGPVGSPEYEEELKVIMRHAIKSPSCDGVNWVQSEFFKSTCLQFIQFLRNTEDTDLDEVKVLVERVIEENMFSQLLTSYNLIKSFYRNLSVCENLVSSLKRKSDLFVFFLFLSIEFGRVDVFDILIESVYDFILSVPILKQVVWRDNYIEVLNNVNEFFGHKQPSYTVDQFIISERLTKFSMKLMRESTKRQKQMKISKNLYEQILAGRSSEALDQALKLQEDELSDFSESEKLDLFGSLPFLIKEFNSMLMFLCEQNHLSPIRWLIEKGAVGSKQGISFALNLSISNTALDKLNFFLQQVGFKVDDYGNIGIVEGRVELSNEELRDLLSSTSLQLFQKLVELYRNSALLEEMKSKLICLIKRTFVGAVSLGFDAGMKVNLDPISENKRSILYVLVCDIVRDSSASFVWELLRWFLARFGNIHISINEIHEEHIFSTYALSFLKHRRKEDVSVEMVERQLEMAKFLLSLGYNAQSDVDVLRGKLGNFAMLEYVKILGESGFDIQQPFLQLSNQGTEPKNTKAQKELDRLNTLKARQRDGWSLAEAIVFGSLCRMIISLQNT